jgi:2,5-diketo-D-gluconate reductase A
VQSGDIVFPKSMNRARMQENFELFDFQLDDSHLAAIDELDRGEAGRLGPNPDVFDWIP